MKLHLVSGCLSLLVCGCGATPAPTPLPRVAAFLSPSELLPADLDVALRFDLARFRSLRAAGELNALVSPLSDPVKDGAAPVTSALPWRYLFDLRGASLWLGFRGLSRPDRDHRVSVVQDDFRGWNPVAESPEASVESRWRRVAMPAPGVVAYGRKPRAEVSEPVRLALLRGRLMVLASLAEVDSVDRILRAGPDARHLDPPADGPLGFALRPRALRSWLGERYANLAQRLGDLTAIYGSADREQGAFRFDVALSLVDEAAAQRSERWLRALVSELSREPRGSVSMIARKTSLRREGPTALRLVLLMNDADVAELIKQDSAAESARP